MSRWLWPTIHFLGRIRHRIPYPLCVLHSQRYPSNLTTQAPAAPLLLPVLPVAVDHGLGPVSILANYLSMREEDISRTPALTFKSLYLSAKDCTMLRCLQPKQMTFMISMFGSLSIRPSPQSCIYVLKVVPCINNPTENTYWPFVLEIARDKEKLGYPLNGTDRFWIMRAELAVLSTLPGVSAQQRCISRAVRQYIRIWRHTPDPEVHAPLLEALLSNPSSTNLSGALKRLLRVLSLHGNPHQRLLNIFWKIVLEHGATLSSTQQSDILSLCFDRVGRFGGCGRHASTSDADIPKLGAALAGRLFPWYLARLPCNDLQHWVSKITIAAFQPSLPPETRWSNLLLLAICVNPHHLKLVTSSSHLELAPETIEWRTILILSTLERAVTSLPLDAVSHNLANILRSLWRLWRGIDGDRPPLASQAIVASFLRLSSIAKDKEILRDCVQYSEARKLWSISENCSDAAGGIHVFTSYMIGLVNCHGRKWSRILDIVDSIAATDAWRTKVVSALLSHFIVHDITTAHEIYQSVLKRNFDVPLADAYNVATKLVAAGQLEDASQLLQTPSLPPHLMERLLGDILRFVKSTRPRSLASDFAAKIGNAMQTLYSSRKPLAELKYPIRFFLSLMVSSGHASGAVSIAKALAKHSPSVFTARFFVRLLGILMRCRQFKCAQQVFQIAREITPSRTIDIAQAKLVISLVNAGATTLACGLYPKHRIAGSLRTRLSIARTMSRRPSAHATLRILKILSRHPQDERTIQDAILSLVRARCTAAAIKLLRSKCTILTPKSITAIGNTILQGILHGKQRNGRHIARILGTKAFLEKACRFTPDRVTTNIIVKAVLFLRPVIHISQMKNLFDHFIRLGYPSGPRWNHDDNVPFGSPLKTIPQGLQLPVVTSPPSFKKHVRPLFKMFIKAFYLRGDHDAAKIVIGILKGEQTRIAREWEKRERARRKGIDRKKRLIANCHRTPTTSEQR